MPLFFHTQTDTRFSDEEGIEFAIAVEAHRLAIKSCGELMRDEPKGLWGLDLGM